jgi:hypothetical protein
VTAGWSAGALAEGLIAGSAPREARGSGDETNPKGPAPASTAAHPKASTETAAAAGVQTPPSGRDGADNPNTRAKPARALPLAVHAAQARALVAALRDIGVTDEEIVELSIASETDLREAVGEAVRRMGEIEAMATGLQDRIGQLAARKHALEGRAERIRGAIVSALELADVRRVPTIEATVYLIAGRPGVRILDEDAIPADLRRSKTTTSPDRAAIQRALEAGRTVPGCVLSNGSTALGIRR